jgi:DNA-binding MarR family transcriptional regulator
MPSRPAASGSDEVPDLEAGSAPEHDVEQMQALADAIGRLRRSLRRAIRPIYSWEALPMRHVELLQLIAEQPGIAVGEVAISLRLASNTVSTLVGELLAEGLVIRRADERDRRIGRLTVGDKGEAVLESWRIEHVQLFRDAVTSMTPANQEELLGAVAAIDALGVALHGRTDLPSAS